MPWRCLDTRLWETMPDYRSKLGPICIQALARVRTDCSRPEMHTKHLQVLHARMPIRGLRTQPQSRARMHAHSCSRKQVHMHSAHSHAPKACPHSRVHKARAFTHTCNGTRALQLRQVSLFLADSGLYHDSVQILSHALSCEDNEQDEARRADLRQALAQVQSQEQKARASGSYSRDFGREARMLWPSGGWSWG